MIKQITYIALLIGIPSYAQLESINISYEYDNLNRLVQVVSNAGNGFENNYEYDNLGNRLIKELDNSTNPDLTYVPDDAFEQKLIDFGYDDVIDDYVVTNNIISVTELPLQNGTIADLTGIEDFAALEILTVPNNQLAELLLTQNNNLAELNCGDNNLTSLDISQNANLIELSCAGNQLTELNISSNILPQFLFAGSNLYTNLDVSNNSELVHLYCFNNPLTTIDVTNNPLLETLSCSDTQISNIDVTQNQNLKVFEFSDNNVSQIDLSQNSQLLRLDCDHNQLQNLDISQNLLLEDLDIQHNQISGLDVTNNSELRYFAGYNNQITNLDFSGCQNLVQMYAGFNNLDQLNVRNGNNQILESFSVPDNPNLFCIQVDDENAANNGNGVYGNWIVDAQVNYSESCTLGIEDNLITSDIIITPNPASNSLAIILPENILSDLSVIKIYDTNGRLLVDKQFDINNLEVIVPLNNLQVGTYLIKITNGNQNWSQLFIKE